MRLRHTLIAAAAVAAALSTPALAHRQWLLPSTTTLAGTSEYVTVDAAVSNDLFYADHVAIDPEQVQVWAPDGSKAAIENAAKGRYRGTFDVKIDKPGTWAIGIERAGVGGTFKVDGETWRAGMMRGRPGGAPNMAAAGAGGAAAPAGAPAAAGATRAPMKSVATPAEIPANATEVKLTETLSRNMTYVTAGAPTKTAFAPRNKGLDFDPITHPSELVSDEEAQFRFLVDGKPAAGVKVTIVPGGKKYRAAEDAQELTTGSDGVLKVSWPVAGMYWLSASVSDTKPSEARATERRMNFTTTLEVVAP